MPFMRSAPRPFLVTVLLVGVLVLLSHPCRGATLAVLHFPFSVVKMFSRALIMLPHMSSLTRENADLRRELVQRQLDAATLRERLRHVQQSQALLQALAAPQGMVARVIGRSTLPSQQTVWLDRGERDGLTLDSVILDPSGVIGRVSALQASNGLVLLLTDPESRVAALIERSRETGVLVGHGRRQCELRYLDAEADVQEGDRVVTAGLGGSIPKGLPLGTVTRIERDEETGSASAWVMPSARLGQLEEVLCLPSKE